MSFKHGFNGYFNLDDGSGTPTDISAYLNKVKMQRSAEAAETSTFGDQNKDFVAGLKSGTIQIEGRFDPAIDTILDANLGAEATKTFVYGPQGSTAGLTKYTGECIVTAYEPDDDVAADGSFTATMQITGAVTRSTF